MLSRLRNILPFLYELKYRLVVFFKELKYYVYALQHSLRSIFAQHLLNSLFMFLLCPLLDEWLKACGMDSDPCINQGYVGKDCKCICPMGSSGDKCEDKKDDYNGKQQTHSQRSRFGKLSHANLCSKRKGNSQTLFMRCQCFPCY